jgi:hypothetical protein
MKKIIGMILLFCMQGLIWADSLVLVNDSNVQLSAVIQDATGTILEETVIDPQDSSTWSLDSFFGFDANVTNPQTPYTVNWYCMSGDLYSTCRDVPSDSTVMAQSCMGGQQCN